MDMDAYQSQRELFMGMAGFFLLRYASTRQCNVGAFTIPSSTVIKLSEQKTVPLGYSSHTLERYERRFH
jgi:hypothetical protein